MTMNEGMEKLLKPFRWYLAPHFEGESIIGWWEKRRFFFNLFVFLFNLPFAFIADLRALGIMAPDQATGGSSYSMTPSTVLPLVQIIVQIMANVWYTGGWMVELLLRLITGKRFTKFGPIALLSGTIFSLVFVIWLYIVMKF